MYIIVFYINNIMNVLLYGYYNMGNFGDDIFEYIFTKYFNNKSFNCTIVNPNTLIDNNLKHNKADSLMYRSGSFVLNNEIKHLSNLNILENSRSKIDLIFLGGGEIINEYFMLPLFQFIKNNNLNNIPIFGASVGYNIHKSNKYIRFIDKCIFRNKVNLIDNINYFYDNDIVFGLQNYINDDIFKNIEVEKETLGIYLINEINNYYYDILKNYINIIKSTYKIKFVVFDKLYDPNTINKLILDCNLISSKYIIKSFENIIDTIREILSNEKHFCIRFHAHVICYSFKLSFVSFPLTNKTKEFNNLYNIPYSFNVPDMINNTKNLNIAFKNLKFNFKLLDSFFCVENYNNTTFKLLSVWSTINEIFENFHIIYTNKNSIIKHENKIKLTKYVKYISDQIELNILGYLNSTNKYGINIAIENLILSDCNDYTSLQNIFIRIITNLI